MSGNRTNTLYSNTTASRRNMPEKKNCSKLPLKTSVKIKCLSRQTCLKLKALCMQE